MAAVDSGGKALTGTQVVRMILEDFRFATTLEKAYTHADMSRMKWFGDNHIVKYFHEMEKLFKNLHIDEEGNEIWCWSTR